jgi:hypothetical protein
MTTKMIGFGALSACLAFTIACGDKTQQATSTNTEGATSQAPSGQQAANQKTALVRFVDAVPGPSVDLWFGDQKAFADVGYKTVTRYKELPGERHDFKLAASGETNPNTSKITNSEGLNNGDHYTIVASVDKDGKEKLDVITDRLTEPASGKAKVRVINASAEEVDVYSPIAMSGTSGSADRTRNSAAARTAANEESKWFSGVDQASSTTYKDVDPMNGSLQIRPAGRRHAPAGVSVDLSAGKLYTLVVTGGAHGKPLDVVRVEDELTGPAASAAARPTGGPVR